MSAVHVRVRVAGEEYALPVSGVSEVAEVGDITPIPGAPARIIGAINLRGQVVPVIDMAAALGGPAAAEPTRIVIAEHGAVQAGLAVDEVVDVTELGAPTGESDSPFLSGAAFVDGDLIGMVDLGALLAPEPGRRLAG